MSEIPRSPERFFNEYVPEQVARLKDAWGDRTSAGSVVFELLEGDAWSLALERGALRVTSGAAADALVRITLGGEDFVPVVVAGAERLGEGSGFEKQLVAARVLAVDDEKARLLRDAPGSVALKLDAGGNVVHRLVITLGSGAPKLDAPDCELACSLEDLWSIQSGTKNAFELLMEGKLQLTGKIELAMALGAALG